MKAKPPVRVGVSRIFYAFGYTFSGLRHALKYEDAFRQEVILFSLASIGLCFLPVTGEMKVIIFSLQIFVMITELLNTAIEAVVDLASPDYHELAKQAKDIASAAVFFSFMPVSLAWIYAVYTSLIKLII